MRKLLVLVILGLTSLFADYKLVLTDVDGNQTEQCVKSYNFSNNLESIARQKGVDNDVYSEKEIMTNKVYLGKPVYRRVFLFDDYAVPRGTNFLAKETPVIADNIDRITNFDYMAVSNGTDVLSPANSYYDGSRWFKIGFCNNKTKKCRFQMRHNEANTGTLNITDLRITVEYTKTTDKADTSLNKFKSYLIYSLSSSLNDTVIVKDMKNLGVQLLENYTYDASTNSCIAVGN